MDDTKRCRETIGCPYKREIYTISPYHLVWNDDHHYVVGYSEKREKIVTFRVDRIASQPDILSADAVPVPEDFDIVEFTKHRSSWWT